MKPYERFDAWRACHRLVLAVYQATRDYPDHERYGLVAQTRRAAASAPLNMAEGSARRRRREFRRFLDIANASLSEVAYALHLAKDLGYLTDPQSNELFALREDASRLTWKLYESMGREFKPSKAG